MSFSEKRFRFTCRANVPDPRHLHRATVQNEMRYCPKGLYSCMDQSRKWTQTTPRPLPMSTTAVPPLLNEENELRPQSLALRAKGDASMFMSDLGRPPQGVKGETDNLMAEDGEFSGDESNPLISLMSNVSTITSTLAPPPAKKRRKSSYLRYIRRHFNRYCHCRHLGRLLICTTCVSRKYQKRLARNRTNRMSP